MRQKVVSAGQGSENCAHDKSSAVFPAFLLLTDSSALVQNGPDILAECLVQLGKQLHASPSVAWISMQGNRYHSTLGRRVQRLLGAQQQPWAPPRRAPLSQLFLPIATALVLTLSTGWFLPTPSTKGEPMNWKSQIKQSLAGLMVLAAVRADSPANGPNSVSEAPEKPLSATNIEKKLKSISVSEVEFKDAPLRDVVQYLDRTMPASNDQKIEFLIGTGGGLEDPSKIEQVQIHISPPLRNVRLRYLLDVITRSGDAPIHFAILNDGVLFLPGDTPMPHEQQYFSLDSALRQRYSMKIDPKIGPAHYQRRAGPPDNLVSAENDRDPKRKPSVPGDTWRGKSEIETALQTIIFKEARYDGVPLGRVIRDLMEEIPRLDSRQRRMNFVILQDREYPGKDLGEIVIHLNSPLREIKLGDLLDAITRMAEQPIHFTVEDYGIAFLAGNAPAPNPTPFYKNYKMDPLLAARSGLKVESTAENSATSQTDADPASHYRNRYRINDASNQTTANSPVLSKLNNIILDEVVYDGLPLSEVVRDLGDESRKHSADKLPVNFLFSARAPSTAWPNAVDAMGNPLPPRVFGSLPDTQIRLVPLLHKISMKDLLDAIVQTADRPIRYEILPYGVVFSLADVPAQSPAFELATFHVDPATFSQALDKTFGLEAQPAVPIEEKLARALSLVRIQLGSPGKSIFYNPQPQDS